jgi:hypothetical protein
MIPGLQMRSVETTNVQGDGSASVPSLSGNILRVSSSCSLQRTDRILGSSPIEPLGHDEPSACR